MNTLCIILARAGSKGFPSKNIALLDGAPLIAHTIEHARAASCLDRIIVSTDGPAIAAVAKAMGVEVVDRPALLASDIATVDSAARDAVRQLEEAESTIFDAIVILYGNVPLRPAGLIDRAAKKLRETGCDSVQSVYPVGKTHPYWMKQLGGADGDELIHYQPNAVYRRQDLPPVFMLDGGIIAVTRSSLFTEREGEPHAFLGRDRRAVVTQPDEVVDVDSPLDLAVAQAVTATRGSAKRDNSSSYALAIRQREIGAGQPAYVIAELGVNHDGSLGRALELTHAAKAAGADAIKLQLFDPHLLLSNEAALAEYQKSSAADVFEMLSALELSATAMQQVRDLAHELGLAFIVTPFSMELAGDLRKLDVDAIKIASPDAVNLPLIEAMLALGKPMIVSTGTCDLSELIPTAKLLTNHPAALLHCVSAYPVAPHRADLTRITKLRDRFGLIVGYSDHTTDLHSGMLAVCSQQASLVERHLTYDRAASGPDHAASLDPKQFAQYVQLIRAGEASLRVPAADDATEREVRKLSRQSLCTKRALEKGHVISRDDLTVKRPGTGIPAAKLSAILGQTLTRNIPENSILHEEDVEGQRPEIRDQRSEISKTRRHSANV